MSRLPLRTVVAFAAVWPILLNTAAGVHQLDRHWLLLAKSLAATRWETLPRVIIPGVLGFLLDLAARAFVHRMEGTHSSEIA